MAQSSRQEAVLRWASDNFGSAAFDKRERAHRMLEEAIELGQACGVDMLMAGRIVNHVYSRQTGAIDQEIAGLALALDALAENYVCDVQRLAYAELDRILGKPREYWIARHREKSDAGIAKRIT